MAHVRVYAIDFKLNFSPSSPEASRFGDSSLVNSVSVSKYFFQKFGPCTFDAVKKLGQGVTVDPGPCYTIDVEVPGEAEIICSELISIKNVDTSEVQMMDIVDFIKKVHEHAEGYRAIKTEWEPETGL
jgi:hypothetical protein